MLGAYYQAIATDPYAVDNYVDNPKLLRPEEVSFIRGIAAYGDLSAMTACQATLHLQLEYFHTVKHQIVSLRDA